MTQEQIEREVVHARRREDLAYAANAQRLRSLTNRMTPARERIDFLYYATKFSSASQDDVTSDIIKFLRSYLIEVENVLRPVAEIATLAQCVELEYAEARNDKAS